MDEAAALVQDIEDYCRRHGMAESAFGRLSVNDGKFIGRARGGGRVTTATLEKIRDCGLWFNDGSFVISRRRP